MTIILALLLAVPVAAADLPQIHIEAENYTEVTGGSVRVLDRAEASGGQCVSYWEEPDVAVTCEFEVPEAGEYCLTLGYALNWPDTRREVRIDGEPVPGLEDVVLPTTGSWADFSAVTLQGPDGGRARIPLEAGTHTLTLANVDSRGLAWDYAVFHGPEDLLADAPLSEAELQEFAETLPDGARELLLEGAEASFMTHGDVSLALQPQMPFAMRVADVFFALTEDAADAEGVTVEELGPLRVVAFLDDSMDPPITLATITNGHSVMLVLAFESAVAIEGKPNHLPPPLVAWRDGTPWRLAPEPLLRRMGAGDRDRSLAVDGVLASVDAGLTASVRDDPFGHLDFEWQPLRTGRLTVATAKIGPSVPPADTRVRSEIDGDEIAMRSATDMPPALARFYGIAQFEVRVRSDGSMTITTEAGETLELPAP